MSTPPNPPSTPAGPPTEPAGTPVPETASIPEPTPEPASPEPEPTPAPALSLEKTPAAPAPEPAPASASEEATVPLQPAPSAPEAAEPTEPATVPLHSAPATVPLAPAPAAPSPATVATPFAPPTPAPPAAPAPPAGGYGVPGAHGAPGAPGNVWAQPGAGHGYGPGPYPGYPQGAPEATNGLAIAALIVGGFGIVFGFIPFLFWAGALTAVVGIGLGIGALVRASKGGPHKPLAILGTVLGVLGLGASGVGFFLTVGVVDRIDRKIEEEQMELGPYPSGDPWPSSTPYPYPSKPSYPSKSPSPSQIPGMTSALAFGETFTYPSGVKVSISVPKKYVTKSEYLKVGNAVQMTVTITNDSDKTLNVIYAMPNVRDDNGMTGKIVFDGDLPKMIRGDILPGASASGVVAYEVPEGTTKISADISPATLLAPAKFGGPIG
ncbi:DUF4190 domain-containing protein [Streptomyces sp. NPDC046685]|uniref:DUF4190 domain-containing protein n=1 Tax=Streptomyces sp. NPDC046685 TaxID=3157202 RepID=UPI0033F68BAE